MKKYLWLLVLIACQSGTYADDLNSSTPSVSSSGKSNAKYYYFYTGETLAQALQMFAKNTTQQLQVGTDVSNSVLNKHVIGRFGVEQSNQLLDILAKQYGFNWFSYSGVIYITSQKTVSQSIMVDSASMSSIQNTLATQGLLNDRFGFSTLPSQNRIIITGPAQYVSMLAAQIHALDVAPQAEQFAIYHLKYANATDLILNFNGKDVTIPGVATILQALLSKDQSVANKELNSQTIEPIKNQAEALLASRGSGKSSTDNPASNDSPNTNTGVVTTPIIQADNRLNTIIIRDKKENLGIYQQLISLLDVPAPLIEVDVLDISLDEEKLQDAGINWLASIGGATTGFGVSKLLTQTTAAQNNIALYSGGIAPGQSLVNSTANFMIGLNFLQHHDFAQTVSRPSLVTTDNLPAIISSVNTMYLTPGGIYPNSSFQVNQTSASVTTALSITPHVIYLDNNQKEIKLSIILQDGSINELSNSVYPDTVQDSLNSQAVITEGQSLLIAGYSKSVKSMVETKVPILGDIPLLGWFFKRTRAKDHKLATVYLVTPKILYPGHAANVNSYTVVDNNKIPIATNYANLNESVESK